MYKTSLVQELQEALALAVSSPYALSFKVGQSMPDPGAYLQHDAFARDYAVYTYSRKLNTSSDVERLTREALLGFEETEAFVASTNKRLRNQLSGFPGGERLLSDVRSKVSKILGPFRFEEFANSCEWGPGATSSLKTIDARIDKKILERELTVTARCLPYARAYLKYDTGWLAARCGVAIEGPVSPLLSNFRVVRASRLTTVPKTYKERRVIDIQPTFNLFLQKGVGSMIRRRLQRDGIDLDSQTRNQILAQYGLRLNLATIDLSKASDTIATELVRLLLPSDWFKVLMDLRTDTTDCNGQQRYLQKFSAMGNGFTFELESLIFHALCAVVKDYEGLAQTEHGVYGDDIVIDRRAVKCLYSCFRLFGFIPNKDKSWSTTLFRESCGKHFFDGFDVTPLYQKEEITDAVELARAANRLIRWNFRINGYLDCDLLLPYLMLRDLFHTHFDRASPNMKFAFKRFRFRPLQPFGLEGDFGLIDPDPFLLRWNSMLHYPSFSITPVKERADDYALYALSLRRGVVTQSPFLGFTSLKGCRMLVQAKMGKIPSWLDLSFPSVI